MSYYKTEQSKPHPTSGFFSTTASNQTLSKFVQLVSRLKISFTASDPKPFASEEINNLIKACEKEIFDTNTPLDVTLNTPLEETLKVIQKLQEQASNTFARFDNQLFAKTAEHEEIGKIIYNIYNTLVELENDIKDSISTHTLTISEAFALPSQPHLTSGFFSTTTSNQTLSTFVKLVSKLQISFTASDPKPFASEEINNLIKACEKEIFDTNTPLDVTLNTPLEETLKVIQKLQEQASNTFARFDNQLFAKTAEHEEIGKTIYNIYNTLLALENDVKDSINTNTITIS